MFNIAEYSQKLHNRISELNERFAELRSNTQLMKQEMRFIELEIAGLNGQSTMIRLMNDSNVVDKNNKEIISKD